jgi:hypothetical protein
MMERPALHQMDWWSIGDPAMMFPCGETLDIASRSAIIGLMNDQLNSAIESFTKRRRIPGAGPKRSRRLPIVSVMLARRS